MSTVSPPPKSIKFPGPLADGHFPLSSVLMVLAHGLDILFGTSAPAAMLACICALSGRTGTPLRVWLRGEIQLQRTLVRLIELILGAQRVLRISSVTDAGLVALESRPAVELLVISADLSDRKVRGLVEQVVSGSRISHLDAPGGEEIRYRTVTRQYAIVLMGDAFVDSDEALGAVINLKLDPDKEALKVLGRLLLASFYPNAHQLALSALIWARGLRESFEEVVWTATVDCDQVCGTPWIRAASWGDAERLRQLHALIRVLCLIELGDNPVPTIQATKTSGSLAMALLDAGGVEDARGPLPPALIKLLVQIHRWVKTQPKDFDGAGIDEIRYLGGPAFSVPDLMANSAELAAKTSQTLHSQMDGLEKRGYVEWVGFAGLRKLFRLTTRGLCFDRSMLAANAVKLSGISHSKPAGSGTLAGLIEEVVART